MTRRPATQLTFHDDAGCIISNSAEINTRVTDHFSRQFTDPTVDGLDAFTGEPSQLTRPITPEEVTLAIGKLNTGRASGHDDITAEFLKCSAELLSHTIANIFNDALQHHELLDIGKGLLILVQKPGKPTGPLTSLRPIVLLSVLRKTLSLFSDLAHLTSQYMSCALFYIAGDFNSKIGLRKCDEEFMGNHSRGRRNINGNALADFLEVHSLFICNTAFQHSARHKTTWQGQRRDAATGQVVPIYNAIDFVICRQSHKRLLVDSRTYAGPLLDSDHRLLTA